MYALSFEHLNKVVVRANMDLDLSSRNIDL